MSATGAVLDTVNKTVPNVQRYIQTASTGYDPLTPEPFALSINPIAVDMSRSVPGNLSSNLLGTTNVTYLPTSNKYIMGLDLEMTFSALNAGNWTDYVGLAAVQKVRIKCGGETLEEYDYDVVTNAILARNDQQFNNRLRTAAGSTGFASGTVAVPIWFFPDELIDKSRFHHRTPLLATTMPTNTFTVEIDFRAAASCIDAGATLGTGNITSSRLFVRECDTTQELKEYHNKMALEGNYKYKATRFQSAQPATVATATATNVNISSFRGIIRRLYVIARLSSNLSTANDRFIQAAMDSVYLYADGLTIYQNTSNAINQLTAIRDHEWGNDDTTVTRNCVVIDLTLPHGSDVMNGGLNVSKVNQLILNITQSTGANVQIDVCAESDVLFVMRGNYIDRYE